MKRYDIVIIGLTLSSSWGNGHATTYRALLGGLHKEDIRVLFLERDAPWYAANRDLPDPDFCTLAYFHSTDDLFARFGNAIATANAVIVGSYVPEGPKIIDRLAVQRRGLLCFYDIDTPVTLGKLDRGDEEYLRRDQIPLFDAYFSFSSGEVLDSLALQYGARCPLPLCCSVDEGRYHPIYTDLRWDLGYLGTYSADRQPTLERLLIEPARRLPEKRFVVAGPQYPADIDWPNNVERIEHLPPSDHALFYNQQRYTLNVTRADMIAAGWSPSVRLFEAGACGTPVISDMWRGLGDFFPLGEAILTAQTSGDIVRLIEETNEATRGAIASRARKITLDAHTGLARARQFLNDLRQLQGDASHIRHAG